MRSQPREAWLYSRRGALEDDLDLCRRLGTELLAHERADEPMNRKREDQVEDEGRRERRDEGVLGDDFFVQEVVEDVSERTREQRDRADGDDGSEALAAAGRLAVAAGPEPGERQDERGDAERPEGDEVDDQAADEAEHRSGDRAAQEPERDDDDEQKVGRAAAR